MNSPMLHKKITMHRLFRILDSDFTQNLYSRLPFPGISRPVFIIGCGRSGTTILGKILSKHKNVTYLNEPRKLWFSVYPETDIWSHEAYQRDGKLLLTEDDASKSKNKKISRIFRYETFKSGNPVLVEKLPINSFRLYFIKSIFPDARFIYIYRNGLEVARSIEKLVDKGWFGSKSYKWKKLTEYALSKSDLRDLPAMCVTNYDRGLLEWRLSVDATVNFLSSLSPENYYELKYNRLIEHPVRTVSEILNFIGVGLDPIVINFASNNLVRKSKKLDRGKISQREHIIGGKLLYLSIKEENGLTCCF